MVVKSQSLSQIQYLSVRLVGSQLVELEPGERAGERAGVEGGRAARAVAAAVTNHLEMTAHLQEFAPYIQEKGSKKPCG